MLDLLLWAALFSFLLWVVLSLLAGRLANPLGVFLGVLLAPIAFIIGVVLTGLLLVFVAVLVPIVALFAAPLALLVGFLFALYAYGRGDVEGPRRADPHRSYTHPAR